jgi:hypothetical protein
MKQTEQYDDEFKKCVDENCYCNKINKDFPVLTKICNYCFLSGRHYIIEQELQTKIDTQELICENCIDIQKAREDMKESIIKAIPNYPEIAKNWHNCYEKVAQQEGWQTQKDCRVEFDKLPEKNKRVMLMVSKFFMDSLINDIKEVK